MPTTKIEVNDVVFEYPGVRALDHVSFTIDAGEISALVGPNGAGKTTLLKCLAALSQPLSGTVTLDGLDVMANPRTCHRKVGYLPDFFGLYNNLSVRQCLTYAARAHDIDEQREHEAVARAAERLHISDRLDARAGTLSRGLAQRLAIAQAIVHEPNVLLLDEPASGLDPEARQSLARLFLELKAQGMTLLVSSHILSELEEYSDSMIIVKDGRIMQHQDLAGAQAATARMRLATSGPVPELRTRLEAVEGITELSVEDDGAAFSFTKDKGEQAALLAQLIEQGVPVCAFGEERANLQETYLSRVREMEESG